MGVFQFLVSRDCPAAFEQFPAAQEEIAWPALRYHDDSGPFRYNCKVLRGGASRPKPALVVVAVPGARAGRAGARLSLPSGRVVAGGGDGRPSAGLPDRM
jgi:hypothetical protein